MQRTPVESSDIISVGYDAASRLLEVEFHGGRVYQYREVEPDIHAKFMQASSFGTFFFAHVNGRYRYQKIKNQTDTTPSNTITFVTEDTQKLHSLSSACEPFGLQVEQLQLVVDEIQSDNPEELALKKARRAYEVAKRPLLVTNTYWSITALKGFPGAYMRHINQWLTADDIVRLMHGKSDRSVRLTETLAYYDGAKPKVFSGEFWGVITEAPKGEGDALQTLITMHGQHQTVAEVMALGHTFVTDDSLYRDCAKWLRLQLRFKR